ncbi:MAG: hypothetical protein R3C27_14715 [Hyphomonadaceae bacterium]
MVANEIGLILANVGGAMEFGAIRAFDALHVVAGGERNQRRDVPATR